MQKSHVELQRALFYIQKSHAKIQRALHHLQKSQVVLKSLFAGQVRFILEGTEDQVVHYPLPLSGVCETFNGRSLSDFRV